MRQTCFAILFIFIFSDSFSQIKADTLRFYYDINVYSAEKHHSRLDSLVLALQGKLIKVKILGYADFLNDDVYNQILSQRRADGVKVYFMKKYGPDLIKGAISKGLGERFSKENGTTEGEFFQRRVDLIIEPFSIKRNDPVAKKDSLAPVRTKATKIENMNVGESLVVEGLNFEPGRHYVVRSAIPILNNLLKVMQNNPNLKIEIQGHICCLDGSSDGRDLDTGLYDLSLARARSVYDFLVKNGISKERLSYKGFGHSKPKFWPEDSESAEQGNRRVEILVLEK